MAEEEQDLEFYSAENVCDSCDSDEITGSEEGFMQGYLDAIDT